MACKCAAPRSDLDNGIVSAQISSGNNRIDYVYVFEKMLPQPLCRRRLVQPRFLVADNYCSMTQLVTFSAERKI